MAVSSAEDCPLTQEACPYISLHTRRVLIWVSHWMSSLYFDLYGNHLRTFFTVGVLCVVFLVLCLFTGLILSCPTPLICSLPISVSGWRCTCTRHLMTWKFSWKQKAERQTLWGGIFFLHFPSRYQYNDFNLSLHRKIWFTPRDFPFTSYILIIWYYFNIYCTL